MIDAVFENPTDLEVNFKLLEEQTRVGDLRGAAATLDRILLLDPDSKLARVLLAEVQFNLGNLATDETALISLRDDETTPPDMLERVEKNLNAIRDAQSPWRYSASFSMARGSAENPRGASASDTILLTDIEVTNDTLDESEAYGEATLVGQVQYQLESQNPQVLKATAVMYHRDYLSYDAGDLSSLQTMVEYQRLVEPTLTFGAKFNLVAISEETYSLSDGKHTLGSTQYSEYASWNDLYGDLNTGTGVYSREGLSLNVDNGGGTWTGNMRYTVNYANRTIESLAWGTFSGHTYGDATNAARAFTARGSAAFSASNSGCSGAGICTIADSVSSYTCTGTGQCTEDNHASVDTSVNASFKLLQNASTDQASVGGIDISAADSTVLASSGDIALLAE